MLKSHIIARYLLFLLAIDGVQLFATFKKSMYSSVLFKCTCHTEKIPLWMHNNTHIQERGKRIMENYTIRLLDIRQADSGVYTCGYQTAKFHECVRFGLQVETPNSHYLGVHKRVVPDNPSEERNGELYWHPKMKEQDKIHLFIDAPVTLFVYVYTPTSAHLKVTWSKPFDTRPSISGPKPFDCNSLEETQRPLNGSCYEASYTIYRLPTGTEIACVVENELSSLEISFIVYKSIFSSTYDKTIAQVEDDSIESRFDSSPLLEVSNLLGQVINPVSTDPPRIPSSPPANDSVLSESAFPPSLDFYSLRLFPKPDLQFFSLSPVACAHGNMSLHCQLPDLVSELELWYLGAEIEPSLNSSKCLGEKCFSEAPVFIRRSGSQSFRLRSESGKVREMYHFDQTPLSITLSNLTEAHSGTYICKYMNFYKIVDIKVKNCEANVTGIPFWPTFAVFIGLGVVTMTLSIATMFCIRSRQKKTVIELISSGRSVGGFQDKRFRNMNIVCHFHDLYPWKSNLMTDNLIKGDKFYNKQEDKTSSHPPTSRKFNQPLLKPPFYRMKELFSRCATWEVDINRIQIQQRIAEGNFSSIYEARVEEPLPRLSPDYYAPGSSRLVALKTIRATYSDQDVLDLLREIQVMVLVNAHPHIIQLLGISTASGYPRILLEYAVHGSMKEFLRENRPMASTSVDQLELPSISSSLDLLSAPPLVKLDVQALLRFGCHVADALIYLESLKLIHRDIAARNVLVTEGYVAKLCDFGLARGLTDNIYVDETEERLPFRWMAPESLLHKQFSLKSDVWSFGVYLWELFSLGHNPYPGLSSDALGLWLVAGNRNSRPSMASPEIYRIMLDCWHTEPSKRPTMRSVLDRLETVINHCRHPSTDSGIHESQQSSEPDSSAIYRIPRPRPDPPIRTVSLPGYSNLPTGYVEMFLEGYLEPRTELLAAEFNIL